MTEFSARTRAANLAAMAERPLDVLVIGGGIVGAWVALAASVIAYRVGLVEKADFASGTSGKTSRLIHGGLRYLQQFRLGVVREAAGERDALLRIAPDLVTPLTFLLPVYRQRGPRRWQLRIGLWLYDAFSRDKVLPRRTWLSRDEALGHEPNLSGDGLVGGALYSDALTNDARLVLRVLLGAADAGALVANYARVAELRREAGRVCGAQVVDEETGNRHELRAVVVVNATGVWAADLQREDRRLKLRPTKGIHLLVPRARLGNAGAVVLPTDDHRVIFVLPWRDLALVGTTDTDYRQDRERVEADSGDVEYLLRAVNAGFPGAHLTAKDVVSTYAGLRPLIDSGEARESDISRGHEILVDPDGLVTVAGGKLTTARAMAEDVLARIAKLHPPPSRTAAEIVDTRTLDLSGGEPAMSDLRSAVVQAARHEMALHVDDVLVRRLGLFHERSDHGLSLAADVMDVLGDEQHWDAGRRANELARYRSMVTANERWREGHG